MYIGIAWLATRKDSLVNTEIYTHDNNGNLATVLDRQCQTTTYTYDPLNRRTKATFQDGTSTNYTYDAGNRITQVQEKDASNVVTATITRTYDGLDRLILLPLQVRPPIRQGPDVD